MERLISAVTVEPVMSEAHVDFLIIRDDESRRVAKAVQRPVRGEPKYDLEQAIARPEDAFESPQDVANMQDVSYQFRHRILQAWESDIRAEMTGENEGGQVRQIDVNALDEIYSAKALLKMQHDKGDDRQLSLHGIR
jgi:hypothetical protein